MAGLPKLGLRLHCTAAAHCSNLSSIDKFQRGKFWLVAGRPVTALGDDLQRISLGLTVSLVARMLWQITSGGAQRLVVVDECRPGLGRVNLHVCINDSRIVGQ